jgi:hypothetical protein
MSDSGDTIEETEPIPVKPKRRLTLKQQIFVDGYVNPNADTFSNGTQSVLSIPGRRGYDYSAASVQASDYLDNPRVQSEIQLRAKEAGLTDMFRLGALRSIANGEYIQKETSQRIVKGKKRTITTLRTPKASEIVKAIDTVNKMVGDYERNRAMANAVSSRFRELAKAYRPRLEPVSKSIHVKVKSNDSSKRNVGAYAFGFMPCYVEHDTEPTSDASTQAHDE